MKKTFLTLTFILITAVLALIFTPQPLPAGDSLQFEYDSVVVRAYFEERAQVAAVAAWKEPWEVDTHKNFLIIDVDAAEYKRLQELGFRLEIDQAATADWNRPRAYLPGQVSGIPGYACYRTVEETYATAAALATDYPQLATWSDIGDSWEKVNGLGGEDLMVLRLTNVAISGEKPKLFIMTAVHAREYTTAELNTRFAEYLVHNYGVDADATWLLDHHEIHLLLQANPDGRKQAETGLSWRKNTNQNYCSATSNSRGADLNRNFEFQWGCCGGSSGSQCETTYRGPSPVSEPETAAIQAYVRDQFPDQRADPLDSPAPDDAMGVFLDIHSFSQLVLWPWGFDDTTTGNNTALMTLGRKFAYFNGYEPDQAIGLYPTDGTTDDFAYGDLGLAAYTFELGTAFFQDCGTFENQIYPDNLPALVYAAKVARTPYLTPAGPDTLDVDAAPTAVAAGTAVTLTATLDDTRFNNQNGSEPTQNIQTAEFYIDTPPWAAGATPLPLAAVDGAFNSPVEAATALVDTTGLPAGRHTLYVRGQDTAGNWGAVSAAFLFIIDPATAPTIGGEVLAADTGLPLTATVQAGPLFQTATDPATGHYQMQIISGTYDLTAVPGSPDYAPRLVPDVVAHDYQTVGQDFLLYPYCPLLSDDVENGVNGWTAQSPWTITEEDAHSPTHAWTESEGGAYGNNVNAALTSPVLDLTAYEGITLDFWQICSTEAGYDYCHVEYSADGGASWQTAVAFDGPQSSWQPVTVDLPALNNQPAAQIRFRFTSDSYVTAPGWHLDDITLRGAGPDCVTALFPQADFTSSAPDTVDSPTQFNNRSSGSDLAFVWDFGDGSPTVTATHPSHIYAAAGDYIVTLTSTNELGADVVTGTVTIAAPPQAGFATAALFDVKDTAVFTNTTTGVDINYAWDFGDGATSTEANPTHRYAAPGVYTVTLQASSGPHSDSAMEVIQALAAPQASFTTSAPDLLGTATQFSSTSSGTDLDFVWDFGDGTTSSAADPAHQYDAVGDYTVTLTVTNGLGADATTAVVTIGGTPQTGFTAASPVAVGAAAVITNSSSGVETTYLWDFGDGTQAAGWNPGHVYVAAGDYTITLTATNGLGQDVAAQPVAILQPPTADFTVSSLTLWVGETAVFTNISTGTALTYQWTFGDGGSSTAVAPQHTFTQPGTYTVRLGAQNGVGEDEKTAVVVVRPQPVVYLPLVIK